MTEVTMTLRVAKYLIMFLVGMARWWHTLKEYNAKQKNTASPLQVNSSSLFQPSDSSWGYRWSSDARESVCYPVKNKHSLAGNVLVLWFVYRVFASGFLDLEMISFHKQLSIHP